MSENRHSAGMVRVQNSTGRRGSQEIPQLEYKILPLARVKVEGEGSRKRLLEAEIRFGGKRYRTSRRFWTSFMAKFGFSDSIFNYYAHQEVFDRICERRPDVELRFCIDPSSALALSVSNPGKPVVDPGSFMEIARKYRGSDVQYAQGVVLSTYVPPSGERRVKIGPDLFSNRFIVETPLDGYGKPSIYLSLLREVCMNGAVAYAPTFRQDITLGDDPEYAISRSLDSFDSDEGYSAVRQRFQAAQSSPASLRECLKLFQTIRKLEQGTSLTGVYEKVVGNLHEEYGMANLNALTEKKLRLLPARCRVYDLLNLASEVSTHHAKNLAEAQLLQAWLGTTISSEYDLEGTSEKVGDFEGVFIKDARPRRRRAAAN